MPTIAATLLLYLANLSSLPPPLRVDVVFTGAPMRPRTETTVLQEVAAIWAAYGVDVRASNPLDRGRDGAIRLAVVLADRRDPHLADNALGAIEFSRDEPTTTIVMYPTAIGELVAETPQGGGADPLYRNVRDLITGRVLGRALAHEVGHYLLRSREHSPRGLMRAEQSVSDLVRPDRRGFVLSTAQAAHLVSTTSQAGQ